MPGQNISANSDRKVRHFGPTRALPGPTVPAMVTLRVTPPVALRPPQGCRPALAAALALALGSCQAQAAAAVDSVLEQQVRALALGAMRASPAGVTRVELAVGALDPRLRLAPCERVEPYLPAGVRLWGKARIGLRCAQGPVAWNVYLPITVKVFGPALVAAAALPAGSVLAATDLTQAEVDLAEEPGMALTDTAAVVGRTLAGALRPGQSLRQSAVRPRQWFAAGETVRVVARGDGFAVASEGQALTPGIEGQNARVRTEGGRILEGLPVAENRIEVAL
jgi:flagellar basal body P-ring formation protein FlgA